MKSQIENLKSKIENRLAFSLVELPVVSDAKRAAFTLVELLVVVAIIVILLAILVPALSKAMTAAEKVQCLAHQAAIVKGCQQFANERNNLFPLATNGGQGIAHAYDLRTTEGSGGTSVSTPVVGVGLGGTGAGDTGGSVAGVGAYSGSATRYPLGWGQLVVTGFLPKTQLGKVIHCPNFDNSASGNGPGHCMDVQHGAGFGGSFWDQKPGDRIIGSFNYRATSHFKSGKGHLYTNKIGSNFVVSIDTPDPRWRGKAGIYGHPDGFNRVFADGSGSFRKEAIDATTGNGEVEDKFRSWGANSDHFDGMAQPAAEERVYTEVLVTDAK